MSVIEVRGSGAIFLNINNSGWELVGLLTVPEHDSAFIEAKEVMEHSQADVSDELVIEDTQAVLDISDFKPLYKKLEVMMDLQQEGISVGASVGEVMDALKELLVLNYDERDIEDMMNHE